MCGLIRSCSVGDYCGLSFGCIAGKFTFRAEHDHHLDHALTSRRGCKNLFITQESVFEYIVYRCFLEFFPLLLTFGFSLHTAWPMSFMLKNLGLKLPNFTVCIQLLGNKGRTRCVQHPYSKPGLPGGILLLFDGIPRLHLSQMFHECCRICITRCRRAGTWLCFMFSCIRLQG